MPPGIMSTAATPPVSCHSHVQALRVDHIKDWLKVNYFNVLHTTELKQPLSATASLLYNNHHASCLFPFLSGAGLLLDPLDCAASIAAGNEKRRRATASADTIALWVYAKKRIGHGFPGGIDDRRLYSLPLKATPLQSFYSECCMYISIGLLLAYHWCTRGQTHVTVGRLQRLISFLRRKGRISDALTRHAIFKTAHLRRLG